jgi:hypothetical protein
VLRCKPVTTHRSVRGSGETVAVVLLTAPSTLLPGKLGTRVVAWRQQESRRGRITNRPRRVLLLPAMLPGILCQPVALHDRVCPLGEAQAITRRRRLLLLPAMLPGILCQPVALHERFRPLGEAEATTRRRRLLLLPAMLPCCPTVQLLGIAFQLTKVGSEVVIRRPTALLGRSCCPTAPQLCGLLRGDHLLHGQRRLALLLGRRGAVASSTHVHGSNRCPARHAPAARQSTTTRWPDNPVARAEPGWEGGRTLCRARKGHGCPSPA